MRSKTTRKTGIIRSDANRAMLVDKLCERWLSERAVTSLYRLAVERLRSQGALAEQLERFRAQEELHAKMLEQLLAELGRNPREEPATFSVNLAASEMEALLELARDERLQPRHVLEVLLAAELLDGSGWELLIELGNQADLEEDWLRGFRMANREENEHVHVVRAQLYGYERDELLARNV